eukprot:1768522-Rhodomonas_salina.1
MIGQEKQRDRETERHWQSDRETDTKRQGERARERESERERKPEPQTHRGRPLQPETRDSTGKAARSRLRGSELPVWGHLRRDEPPLLVA